MISRRIDKQKTRSSSPRMMRPRRCAVPATRQRESHEARPTRPPGYARARRTHMRFGSIGFSIAVVLSAVAVEAQVLTGNVIGIVTDESRAVLPGVTATLTSSALQGRPREGITDEQGRYRFTSLPPGTYTLTLTLSGFATYQEEDL